MKCYFCSYYQWYESLVDSAPGMLGRQFYSSVFYLVMPVVAAYLVMQPAHLLGLEASRLPVQIAFILINLLAAMFCRSNRRSRNRAVGK